MVLSNAYIQRILNCGKDRCQTKDFPQFEHALFEFSLSLKEQL